MASGIKTKKKLNFMEDSCQAQIKSNTSHNIYSSNEIISQKVFFNPHQTFFPKNTKDKSNIYKQNIHSSPRKDLFNNVIDKSQDKGKKKNKSCLSTKEENSIIKNNKKRQRNVSNIISPYPIQRSKSKNTSFIQNKKNICISKNYSIDKNLINNNEKKTIKRWPKLTDFILGKCKGEGKFGKFYPAFHKETGFLFGLKIIKKQSILLMFQQFIRQIKLQYYCKHPNIVKIYSFFSDKGFIYILLQYMQQGCLYDKMKQKNTISEKQVSIKMKQICSAIQYLHSEKILHRDLKPQNIVISHGICKICDFGWAIFSESRRQTHCGTLDYICPQILEGISYDNGVDIWCLGVLVYEMLCGRAPFYNISRKKTMQNIVNRNVIPYPNHVSKLAIDFINRILYRDQQKQKIQIKDLFNHPFLSKSIK